MAERNYFHRITSWFYRLVHKKWFPRSSDAANIRNTKQGLVYNEALGIEILQKVTIQCSYCFSVLLPARLCTLDYSLYH